VSAPADEGEQDAVGHPGAPLASAISSTLRVAASR
jgi:hypothetical protein